MAIGQLNEVNQSLALTKQYTLEANNQFAALALTIDQIQAEGDKTVLGGLTADLASMQAFQSAVPGIKSAIDSLRAQNTSGATAAADKQDKQIIDEQKKTTAHWHAFQKDVEDGLSSALESAFVNGEFSGQKFIENLKTQLRNAAIKITIQAVVNMAMGGLTSLLGGDAKTSQGLFGTTGGLSTLSNGGSLYNLATGNVGGGLYGQFAMSNLGQSMGLSVAGTAATYGSVATGVVTAGETAGATMGNVAFTGSMAPEYGTTVAATEAGLTTLGTAIPYIGAAVAAISIISSLMSKGGGPKTEGDLTGYLSSTGSLTNTTTDGLYTSHSADAQVSQMMAPIGLSIASLIKTLGGNETGMRVALGYNTDPAGTAPDNVSASVRSATGQEVYGQTYDTARGGASAALQLESQRMALAAVEAATGIDKVFTDIVRGIDLTTASASDMSAMLQKLTDVAAIKQEFVALGFDTNKLTTTLIDAAGGTAALQSGLQSYYDNFYTDAEKQAATTRSLSTQFATLGLTMPTTRDAFRDMVTAASNDLSDAGQATFTSLLSMSGAFASVTAATTAATVAARTSTDIANERKSLQDQLDNLTMTSTELLAKQRDALDASNQALFDQVQAATLKKTNDNLLVTEYQMEGKMVEALALQRSLETAGMDASTLAIKNRIYALTDEQTALDALNKGKADQATSITVGYAPGTERDAASLAIAQGHLDASGLAVKTRADWLNLAQSIDPATAAGQALAAAMATLAPDFDMVVSATESAAQKLIALAATNASWQDKIDVSSGAKTQRQVDLTNALAAAGDASTKALIVQYYAQLDANDAATAAAAAATAAASQQLAAQQAITQGWQQTADSIVATMKKLRGDLTTGPQSFSMAQSDFAIATAQARAGDKTAADSLPALAESVVTLGKAVSTTALQQSMLTAATLASLSATVQGFAQYGIKIPAFAGGGYHAGGLRIVGENGPELEDTGPSRIFNMDQMGGGNNNNNNNEEVAAELREVRELLTRLLASTDKTATNTKKTSDTLVQVTHDGVALLTTPA